MSILVGSIFTGMITYLDGLTSLNGVQVMHLIIITIIGYFYKANKYPLEVSFF